MTTNLPPHETCRASQDTPSNTTSRDWRTAGTCAQPGQDPELWFPNGTTGAALLQTEEAKAECRRCPVMETCLQWALNAGQLEGVWGGLSEPERRALKRRATRSTGPIVRVEKAQAREIAEEHRETLTRMFVDERQTSTDIGKALGLSAREVVAAIRELNLTRPKAPPVVKDLVADPWGMVRMRVEERLTWSQIAARLNVSRTSVKKAFKEVAVNGTLSPDVERQVRQAIRPMDVPAARGQVAA